MSYQTNYSKREYFVYVLSHSWDILIYDPQIATAHLTMKVGQIAINFFRKRECQMTSKYLAMLVMFAHLAIKSAKLHAIFLAKENAK
jgi:hypothetical protein